MYLNPMDILCALIFLAVLCAPFCLLLGLFLFILGKCSEGDRWLAEHGMQGYEHWPNFNKAYGGVPKSDDR